MTSVRLWHNTRGTGIPLPQYPGYGYTFATIPGEPIYSFRFYNPKSVLCILSLCHVLCEVTQTEHRTVVRIDYTIIIVIHSRAVRSKISSSYSVGNVDSCEIKDFKVMICRVCGFRVRVWKSFRTSRSRGYGYESVYGTSRSSGYWSTGVQNSHKFRAGTKGALPPVRRVLWHGVYWTHTSSGYGFDCPTELTEVRVRVWKSYRTSRSSEYCGMGVHNLQKFRVRVWMPHITYRSSGYG